MAVAIAAAAILTTVLPIRIVVSRCSGDSFKAARAFAPGLPSFRSVRALARVIEIRATSELAKNADRMIDRIKSKIPAMSSIISIHAG